MLICHLGTINLQFADGSHYTWTKVTTVVHNLIVGTIWIDNYGDVTIENHKTGYSCSLQFIAHSYFNRGQSRRVCHLIWSIYMYIYILVIPLVYKKGL